MDTGGVAASPLDWKIDLFQYLGSQELLRYTNFADILRYRGVFRCPSHAPDNHSVIWAQNGKIFSWRSSYGYNIAGSGRPFFVNSLKRRGNLG